MLLPTTTLLSLSPFRFVALSLMKRSKRCVVMRRAVAMLACRFVYIDGLFAYCVFVLAALRYLDNNAPFGCFAWDMMTRRRGDNTALCVFVVMLLATT